MSVKITCIKKNNGDHENSYSAISQMNWINEDTGASGTSTREGMHGFVVDGGEAYVKDRYGNKAKLVGKTTDKGTKYVKTVSDDVQSDNLLRLPECT